MRQMVMVGFLQAQNCTNLVSSWRHPQSREDSTSADYYQTIGRVLEEGKFHVGFFDGRLAMPDRYGNDHRHTVEHGIRCVKMDPVTVLTVMGMATKRLGLGATRSTTYYEPFDVARTFATLDLISRGRAEMVVGRGSSIEAFPLFGYNLQDYDALFEEKLGLLLNIRANEFVTWSGKYRPALRHLQVYPRPVQDSLPIWIGVGGTPESFIRAGSLGLPLMVAVIGGETRHFRPLVDLYREAGKKAGFTPEQLKVGLHSLGYIADTSQEAIDDFYPGYAESMTKVGKERGWPTMTRSRFESQMGPGGALLVGSPKEVAEKILRHSEALGGISRLTFQMDSAELPHEKLMHSIELIGTHLKPLVS